MAESKSSSRSSLLQVIGILVGILVPVITAVVYVENTFIKHTVLEAYTTTMVLNQHFVKKGEAPASLPPGALLLLDGNECPNGWGPVTDFQGRYLRVGAPELPVMGGNSTITLSPAQMPRHRHGVNDPGHQHTLKDMGFGNKRYSGGGGAQFGSGPNPALALSTSSNVSIAEAGESAPVTIEPTFVALTVCRQAKETVDT